MPGYDLRGKRVWVAGHRGMVGSAVARRLQGTGCEVLVAGRADVNRPAGARRGAVRRHLRCPGARVPEERFSLATG